MRAMSWSSMRQSSLRDKPQAPRTASPRLRRPSYSMLAARSSKASRSAWNCCSTPGRGLLLLPIEGRGNRCRRDLALSLLPLDVLRPTALNSLGPPMNIGLSFGTNLFQVGGRGLEGDPAQLRRWGTGRQPAARRSTPAWSTESVARVARGGRLLSAFIAARPAMLWSECGPRVDPNDDRVEIWLRGSSEAGLKAGSRKVGSSLPVATLHH